VARVPEEPHQGTSQSGPALPGSDAQAIAAADGELGRWRRERSLVFGTGGHHTVDEVSYHWRELGLGSTRVVSWMHGLDLAADWGGGETGDHEPRAELVLSPTAALSLAALLAEDLSAEADPAMLGRRKLGSRQLTLAQDPSIVPGSRFDAEGVPRRYGPLLYHGSLVGALSDRARAAALGLSRSLGSATTGERHLVPAANALVVAANPRGASEEALVGGLSDGLWVRGPIERDGEQLHLHMTIPVKDGQPAAAAGLATIRRPARALGRGITSVGADSDPAAVWRPGSAPLVGRAAALQIRLASG
jgi:hypothetical protein